jgi:hypothetical protein
MSWLLFKARAFANAMVSACPSLFGGVASRSALAGVLILRPGLHQALLGLRQVCAELLGLLVQVPQRGLGLLHGGVNITADSGTHRAPPFSSARALRYRVAFWRTASASAAL